MTPEGIVIFHRNRHLSILFHINYESIFGWRGHLQDTKFVQNKNIVSYTFSLKQPTEKQPFLSFGGTTCILLPCLLIKTRFTTPNPNDYVFLKEYAHQLWPWIKTLQIRREFQECPCHPIIPSSSSSISISISVSISINLPHHIDKYTLHTSSRCQTRSDV